MPLPKVTSYLRNVGKSVVYASVDQLKNTNENVADFLDTNEDVFKSVYASVTDMRRTIKRTRIAIKRSKIYEAADAGWKAVKEDLKTGNFYNKKREDEFGMKAMGSDFSFDFDDDFGFDDDFSMEGGSESFEMTAEDKRTEKQTMQLLDGFAAAVGKSAEAQAKVTSSSIAYLAEVQRTASQMQYVQAQELHKVTTEGFKGIHTGITKLNDALNLHVENSRTFYETTGTSLREMNALMKEFVEMQRNLYDEQRRKPKYKESAIRNITTSGGMPDFAEWGKQIQQNLKNMGGGMADMLLGNGMGDDANMLLALVGSPLKVIPQWVAKRLIPETVTKSMRRTDKIAGGVFSNLMGRMANSRSGYDDGLFGLLSRVFGVDIDSKKTLDPSKYHKGPLPFDGYTRQSIIEVIPTYLRRIEAVLTGQQERVFDFSSGKWKTAGKIKEEYDRQDENDVASAMYDLQDTLREMIKELSENGKAGTAKDLERQTKVMLQKIYNDNGVFRPYKSRNSDIADEDPYSKYGFSKESDFYAVVDYLMKHNKKGLAGMAANVQSQKESRAQWAREAEMGVSAFRDLFNDSMSDAIGKINITTGQNMLSAMKDQYNHSVFDYLRTMVGQLASIARGGIGGGGKYMPGSNRPRPVLSTDALIMTAMGESKAKPSGPSEERVVDEDTDSDIFDVFDDIRRQKEQEARLNGADDKNLTKKQLEKLGIDTSSPLAEQMMKASTLGAKIQVARANIDKLLNKPADFIALQLNKVDQHLMTLMFGKKVEDDEGHEYTNIVDLISKKISDTFDKAANAIDEKMDWIKEKMDPWVKKFQEKIHWKEFKDSFKRQAGTLWGGFKGSMGRTYGAGYQYLRERLKRGETITPDDLEELENYWGDTGTQSTEDSRVDWSQFIGDMDSGMDRDEYDDLYSTVFGSAKGRRIKRTGLTMVSPGEIIIPATFNKRKQNKMKNKELSVFRRMFKKAPTPRTNADGNTKMLEILKDDPEKLALWKAMYDRLGHSDYDVTRNMRRDEGVYESYASIKRLEQYFDAGPTLRLGDMVFRGKSQAERDRDKRFKAQSGSNGQVYTPVDPKESIEQWVNMSAGNNVEPGFIKKVLKENKGFGIDAIAGGALGGGIGLLLGGPLLGAAIGAGINLTKHSETLQNFMFGEVGEDGTRQGGLVGKRVIDGFDKYFGDMKDFGLAGGVAGLITPFGPIGGIMIGSAIGFAKNNDRFKNWLLGDMGSDGKRQGGLMSRELQEHIHAAVPSMTIGAIGGILAGPFSLLPNLALGAGVGFLSTSEEFKEIILGTKNEDGKREGGLVGAFKDGFITPAREKLADFLEQGKEFTIKHVLNPLKRFAKPMSNALLNMASDVAHGITDVASDMLEKSLGGPLRHFMQTRFFGGLLNVVGGLAKIPIGLGKAGIAAPAHALGFLGDRMRMSQIRRGTDRGSTAAERKAFMNKHWISSNKLPFYAHGAKENDERMGKMTQEELDDFIARGTNLLHGDRGISKERYKISGKLGKEILQYFDENGLTAVYGRWAPKIAKAVKTGDQTMVERQIRDAMIPPQHQKALMQLIQPYLDQNKKLNDIRAQGRGTLEELSKKSGFKLKGRRQLRHMLEYAKSEKKDLRFAPEEQKSPEEKTRDEVKGLRETVSYGFDYLVAILRNTDPNMTIDPKTLKPVPKNNVEVSTNVVTQYSDIGNGLIRYDPATGQPMDDKETTETLAHREETEDLQKQQAENAAETAKNTGGFLERLFGDKKGKKKKEGGGILGKMLSLVGSGLSSFFGWGGSVLAKFGIPIIGAGLGISALGWGSQWWKTTAWPSLKNFFLGKEDENGERQGGFLSGLYNTLGEPIRSGIEVVGKKIGSMVDWFKNGGLQDLFLNKIVPNIITGWGYFAENILGPLAGTIIASLPKLLWGTVKGIGKAILSWKPFSSNKALKDQKGGAESAANDLAKMSNDLMGGSGSVTDGISNEYKQSINVMGNLKSSFAKGYAGAAKTYTSADFDFTNDDVGDKDNYKDDLLGAKRTNTLKFDENGNDVTDYRTWDRVDSLGGTIVRGAGRNFMNALSGYTKGSNLISRTLGKLSVKGSKLVTGGILGKAIEGAKGILKVGSKVTEGAGGAGARLRNSILGTVGKTAEKGAEAASNVAEKVASTAGSAFSNSSYAMVSSVDDALASAVTNSSDDLLRAAGSVVANSTDDIAEAGLNAATKGGGVFAKLGKAMSSAGNKAKELLGKITGSSATKTAEKAAEAAASATSSGGFLNVIKNGISKAFKWLADSKVGQIIIGAAKKATHNKFVAALIAPDGMAKFFNKLASVISNIGDGVIAKGASGGLSTIAKACEKFSISPITLIFIVTDFMSGWRNAETSLGVSKRDYTAPWYLKLAAALMQVINGRIFLGLVPKDWIMDKILSVFKYFGMDTSDIDNARAHAEEALKQLNEEAIANGGEVYDNLQDANNSTTWLGKAGSFAKSILNKFKAAGTTTTSTKSSAISSNRGGRGRSYMRQADLRNKRFGMSTIGQAGCGPVAAANMMNHLSGGDRVGDAAAMAQNYIDPQTGGTTINYFHQYFSSNGVPSVESSNPYALMKNIQNGGKAVVLGHGTSSATTDPYGTGDHYINIIGSRNRGQDFIVDDPDMANGRRVIPARKVLGGMKSSVLIGRSRRLSGRWRDPAETIRTDLTSADDFAPSLSLPSVFDPAATIRTDLNSADDFTPGAKNSTANNAATNTTNMLELPDPLAGTQLGNYTQKKINNDLNQALGYEFDFASGTVTDRLSGRTITSSTNALKTTNLGPDAIINIAASQIGYGNGTVHSKYNEAYKGYDWAAHWCAVFVWWVFNQAGAGNLMISKDEGAASCNEMYKWFARKNQVVTTPQKGDIVYFNWGKSTKGNCDHVGIVEGINEKGQIITIEGNTGDSSMGYQYGCVRRKVRNMSSIIHFTRPNYPFDYNAAGVIDMSKYGDSTDYKKIAVVGGQMDPELYTLSQSTTYGGNGPDAAGEGTTGKLIQALKDLGVSVLKGMYGENAYNALFGEAQTDNPEVYGDGNGLITATSASKGTAGTGIYDPRLVGNDNTEKLWNYMLDRGYSKAGAAGILGCWTAESGLEPEKLEYNYWDSSGYNSRTYREAVDSGKYPAEKFGNDKYGWGLAQWTHESRKPVFYRLTHDAGLSISDMSGQLGVFDYEMGRFKDGNKNSIIPYMQQVTDPAQAAKYFANWYEIYKGASGIATRQDNAREIYNKMKDYQKPASTAQGEDEQDIGGMSYNTAMDYGNSTYTTTTGSIDEVDPMELVDRSGNGRGRVNSATSALKNAMKSPMSGRGRGRKGVKLSGSQIRRASGMARLPGATLSPYTPAASNRNDDIYDLIATIIQVLMQVSNNTSVLHQIVSLLSDHLGVDVKASDVQAAVNTGNLDQAQRNLDRLISRSSGNNSNISSLLQNKDTTYLVDAMTALARE